MKVRNGDRPGCNGSRARARRPLRATVAALAAALTLLSASTAWAGQGSADATIEVAPGVYVAKATDHAVRSDRLEAPSRAAEPEPSRPSTRIVGGTATTIEQWPWQASLGIHPDSAPPDANAFERHFCGGSLVAGQYVVTAAHCLFDSLVEADWVHPADLQIVSGRTQLSGAEGQVLNVTDYFWFVDEQGFQLYDPAFFGTEQFDVVLMELASASVSPPIMLAGPGEEPLFSPGRSAFATGWGATAFEGPGSDVLQQVQLTTQSDSTCGSIYGGAFVQPVMLCAGELAGGRDTCQGDSGGPLVVPIDGGGFRLVGDTSFGFECARPGFAGVYGRVAEDPIRTGLAGLAQERGGVNILGSGAKPPGCGEARAALKKAKTKLKQAKRKLRKAKRSGRAAAIRRAKRAVKRASKRVRKARVRVAVGCF